MLKQSTRNDRTVVIMHMKRTIHQGLACSALLIGALCAANSLASTLIYNVQGYTILDGELHQFSALEYDSDRIVATYISKDEYADRVVEDRIDGRGATILPGLIDAHGHVAHLGQALASVDLVGAESEDAAAQRVAAAQGSGDWIIGSGWNQVLWDSKEFPGKASLDALVADKAVALSRVDGHAIWVNSRALELAGIDRDTPDPDGGLIVRDGDGEATGVLVDTAANLVAAVMPPATLASKRQDIERAQAHLVSLGITGVHDAGISALDVAAFDSLVRDNAMNLRVYGMAHMADPSTAELLEAGPRGDAADMFSLRSVKILADGALGSRGAALLSDYSDDPGNQGLLLRSDSQLREDIRRAANLGFQVNVHAIGDRGNLKVLDEFAALNEVTDQRSRRHRIEHAQILRLEDLKRFVDMGVIASIQPTHATSDKNMAGDRLGEERLAGAYAWRSLIESGATLAGGSDFPVEPANPFFGLHAAVTRQSRDNEPAGGWRAEEALTRTEALALFTVDAAYAGFAEQRLGTLATGYAADFILVRDDFFTVDAIDIWRNEVIATVVGGRVVFSRSGSPLGH